MQKLSESFSLRSYIKWWWYVYCALSVDEETKDLAPEALAVVKALEKADGALWELIKAAIEARAHRDAKDGILDRLLEACFAAVVLAAGGKRTAKVVKTLFPLAVSRVTRLSVAAELEDVSKLLRRLADPAHAALATDWTPRLEAVSSAVAEQLKAATDRQQDLAMEREAVRELKERSNAVARGLYGRLIHRFQDDAARAERYFPSVRKEAAEDSDVEIQPGGATPAPAPVV
jgi:hypothetical protein